ncbi:FAD-dependent oxidoreductase [Zafaria sp. Z1313]|uniref:FAD-dependent oxidoreductase n=1 Tax=Zafaria sp. Z1313 TaxID=3423202 RepID=UPI003D303720
MRCVVVGAGIVGLSIAWDLVRAGAHVAVVDPSPAAGATRAAAGMLAAVTEFHYQEGALTALSVPALRGWPAWARELEAASGRACGFRSEGTLVVAADAADREALARLRAAQEGAGLSVEEVGVRAARRLQPLLSPRLAGAFLAADDAQADPRCIAAALRAALDASGRVEWVAGRVLRVAAGAPARVEYDGGSLAADEVVLAGGTGPADGPAGRTRDGFPAGVDPVAGRTATTRPTGGIVVDGLGAAPALTVRPVYGEVLRLRAAPGGPGLEGTVVRGLVEGRGVYIVPRADGEVVLGATEREDDRTGVSAGGVYRLLRDGIRLLPALAELDLVEATARARPATPDNLPLLGRLGPGLITANGFYRHGVLLSVAAAGAVRSLVDGRAPSGLEAFDPWRFTPDARRDHDAPILPAVTTTAPHTTQETP